MPNLAETVEGKFIAATILRVSMLQNIAVPFHLHRNTEFFLIYKSAIWLKQYFNQRCFKFCCSYNTFWDIVSLIKYLSLITHRAASPVWSFDFYVQGLDNSLFTYLKHMGSFIVCLPKLGVTVPRYCKTHLSIFQNLARPHMWFLT